MNIIFLDIDGVLNYNFSKPKKWNRSICERLNKLMLDFNYKIVITSTWRHHYNIPQLQQIFNENGIIVEIIGTTGAIYSGDRGEEISEYLDNGFINNYIVIDDVIEGIKEYIPSTHLIEVKLSHIGLTDYNLERIEKIMKRDSKINFKKTLFNDDSVDDEFDDEFDDDFFFDENDNFSRPNI